MDLEEESPFFLINLDLLALFLWPLTPVHLSQWITTVCPHIARAAWEGLMIWRNDKLKLWLRIQMLNWQMHEYFQSQVFLFSEWKLKLQQLCPRNPNGKPSWDSTSRRVFSSIWSCLGSMRQPMSSVQSSTSCKSFNPFLKVLCCKCNLLIHHAFANYVNQVEFYFQERRLCLW